MVSAGTVAAIRPALSRLSLITRTVIEALLLTGGSIGSAEHVAEVMGLRNRFELARRLRREHLPSLHRLAGWATVLDWMEKLERSGASLCRHAFLTKRDPGACYRVVKRTTGVDWAVLRRRGLD